MLLGVVSVSSPTCMIREVPFSFLHSFSVALVWCWQQGSHSRTKILWCSPAGLHGAMLQPDLSAHLTSVLWPCCMSGWGKNS